jgi:hypothetical protein
MGGVGQPIDPGFRDGLAGAEGFWHALSPPLSASGNVQVVGRMRGGGARLRLFAPFFRDWSATRILLLAVSCSS